MDNDIYCRVRKFAHSLASTELNDYSNVLLDDIEYANSATEILMKLTHHMTNMLKCEKLSLNQEKSVRSMLSEIEKILS